MYTKKVIKEALFELLEDKSLEKITIKSICDTANINRTTFYRNYQDIYDLFEMIEKELIDEAFPEGLVNSDKSRLIRVIYNNQSFYKEFFQSHLESPYIKRIIDQGFIEEKTEIFTESEEKYAYYNYKFLSHGIIGCLKEWVDSGCRENPEMFERILSKTSENYFEEYNKR